MEPTASVTAPYIPGESVELKGQVKKSIEHTYDADEAAAAFTGHEGEAVEIDEATNRRLLRIIDWHLLPLSMTIS